MVSVDERFLPYEITAAQEIVGKELIVAFGADDGIGGPPVFPFIVRLSVN